MSERQSDEGDVPGFVSIGCSIGRHDACALEPGTMAAALHHDCPCACHAPTPPAKSDEARP